MKRKYEIVVLSLGAYARTLRIYSPKKAVRAVIMHDGQNVFYDEDAAFKKSWRAIDALKAAGAKDTAVIGIDCVPATRTDDYLPYAAECEKYGVVGGGNADTYAEFLCRTVLPYLDKRFGYKLYGLLGSSAGAIATMYLATKGIDKFRAYGMFSLPLFVSPDAFSKLFEKKPFASDAMYRIYTGGNETESSSKYSSLIPDLYVEGAHTIVTALRKSGATDIKSTFDNKGVHDETCWHAPEIEFFKDFSRLKIN